MWMITRDVLFEKTVLGGTKSEVGRCSSDYNSEKMSTNFHPFRLLDDDGHLYYEGICDTNDDVNAFGPLDYYIYHSGCTEIQYKTQTGWECL